VIADDFRTMPVEQIKILVGKNVKVNSAVWWYSWFEDLKLHSTQPTHKRFCGDGS
jgi:hypothetical protein